MQYGDDAGITCGFNHSSVSILGWSDIHDRGYSWTRMCKIEHLVRGNSISRDDGLGTSLCRKSTVHVLHRQRGR